jgi:hypothetical protein
MVMSGEQQAEGVKRRTQHHAGAIHKWQLLTCQGRTSMLFSLAARCNAVSDLRLTAWIKRGEFSSTRRRLSALPDAAWKQEESG